MKESIKITHNVKTNIYRSRLNYERRRGESVLFSIWTSLQIRQSVIRKTLLWAPLWNWGSRLFAREILMSSFLSIDLLVLTGSDLFRDFSGKWLKLLVNWKPFLTYFAAPFRSVIYNRANWSISPILIAFLIPLDQRSARPEAKIIINLIQSRSESVPIQLAMMIYCLNLCLCN